MSEGLSHAEAELLWPAYDKGASTRAQNRQLHTHLRDCELCRVRVRARRASLGVSKSEKPFNDRPDQDRTRSNRRVIQQLILIVGLALLVLKIYTK